MLEKLKRKIDYAYTWREFSDHIGGKYESNSEEFLFGRTEFVTIEQVLEEYTTIWKCKKRIAFTAFAENRGVVEIGTYFKSNLMCSIELRRKSFFKNAIGYFRKNHYNFEVHGNSISIWDNASDNSHLKELLNCATWSSIEIKPLNSGRFVIGIIYNDEINDLADLERINEMNNAIYSWLCRLPV